jgi:Ni,Fe-hydrogenase III large subunit
MAEATRTLFAEIEFLLARLGTLALATRATGTISLYRLALDQRESLFAALEGATGRRQYWAIAVPGGARVDLNLEPLQEVLASLEPALVAWKTVVAPGGLVGRACNQVGVISAEQLEAIVPESDATYTEYRAQLAGDVTSRLTRVADDLVACHGRAQAALAKLGEHPEEPLVSPAIASASSTVTGMVSGPHGPIRLSFHLASDGTLHELSLETPEKYLVGALPQLLEGRLLLQVPLILTSLDLCVECLDQ